MKTPSMLSKVLILLFAVIIANLIACSNASFKADKATPKTLSPQPDNIEDPFNDKDSGDAVRCDNVAGEYCQTVDDGLTDDVPKPPVTPPPYDVTRLSDDCDSVKYYNTSKSEIDGVTVWLVVDSSESFDRERLAVGRALTSSFLTTLHRQVPVTIQVIVSHAPSSNYQGSRSYAPSRYAQTFYQNFSVTIRPGMSASQVRTAEASLLSRLDASMQESPISLAKRNGDCLDGHCWTVNQVRGGSPRRGPHSGSDELGLLNFNDAMAKASVPQNNGWVVLFLSDENDICTPEKRGNTFVYSHPHDEKEMYDRFCQSFNLGSVYKRMVEYAGDRPYALGALVYTGQAPVPQEGQNSVGVGYTNLVASAGRAGVMVDLAASGSFMSLQGVANNLVSELAQITNESSGNHTQFPLYDRNRKQISLNQVGTYNPGSGPRLDLQVFVDGRQTNYTIDSDYHLIRPSKVGSQVEIRYCKKGY